MEYCSNCGSKHPNPDTGLCIECEEEDWRENNQDLDRGGTGHGDISHSDADEGL